MLKTALSVEPELTAEGVTPGDYSREELFTEGSLIEVDVCAAWISQLERSRCFNMRHTSYQYKHWAESWAARYVTNGAFIAAALGLGWKHKRDGGSQNVFFRFEEKQFRKMDECFSGRGMRIVRPGFVGHIDAEAIIQEDARAVLGSLPQHSASGFRSGA